MTLQKNWEKTKEMLSEDLSRTVFEAWFEPLRAVSVDEKKNILYVETDNEFIYKTVNDRYLPMLRAAVEYNFPNSYQVSLCMAQEKPKEKPMPKDTTAVGGNLEQEYYLNPRFSFDSFVVGPNNEFAYAAALAVAESPARQYNPLFLYGGSGLGKTHLMHAIGHYILKNFSDKKILYVSAEMFTNELIKALRDGEIGSFKKKYRSIDVLLIDDIQFIEGKDRSEEEFFYTFNTLYDRNKQIIISSDRPPQKLTQLDDRLTSRFLWSVSADIQPPDYETRVAILTNKASEQNIEINDDILEVIAMIARRIKKNVRELEGAFTRIVSFSTLLHRDINTSLAREILKDMLTADEMQVTIDSIKRAVSKYYGISIKEMDSSRRSRNIAYPRQIAMYLSKEMTDNSFPRIGDAFGGRDHTTVIHAHKKIGGELEKDKSLQESIEELKKIIGEG
jgi:chromosomal replication initiator protein